MMEESANGVLATHPLIPSWSATPIPYLSLSAGGLLALADLDTVAQRTAITGGSSWLDALVLAPGLHYQQAADALDHDNGPSLAAELGLTAAVETQPDGTEARRYAINNVATVNYLKRLWGNGDQDDGSTVVINVGIAAAAAGDEIDSGDEVERMLRRAMTILRRQRQRRRRAPHDLGNAVFELDWLSHVFYLLSPLLTVTAATCMILLSDWWGLAFIVALMVSRLLNIFTIRKRCRLPPVVPPSPLTLPINALGGGAAPPSNRPTEYTITLGQHRTVVLRGRSDDLQAITTQIWLRGKTNADGYLEATAKLIVYMVAALSGNLTQAGALVLMVLLLLSAGLLGLSNAHIRGLQMHGRVARPERRKKEQQQCDGKDRADVDWVDSEQGRRDGFPVEDIRGREGS